MTLHFVSGRFGRVLSILICAMFTAPLVTAAVRDHPSQEGFTGPAAGESLSDWTNRWLDGPVGVIATRDERGLYERLESVQERLQFIRLFWERRATQLRGSENEYLDEFARRVDYANKEFSANSPGWDTVFGNITLVFGPPDRTRRELSLPSTLSERPAIIWSYDKRLPEIPPNEQLLFVYQRGRWRLYPPSPLNETAFETAQRNIERSSALSEIPTDYARSMAVEIEASLRNVVNYEGTIERIRAVVRFAEDFGEAEIPFSWSAKVTLGSGSTAKVELTFSWRMDSLIFHEVDEKFATNMLVGATLIRGEEQIVQASERYLITVSADEMEEGMRSGRVVQRSLTLAAPQGRYELQLTLLDQLLGYRTAYRDELEVGS